MTPVRLEPAPPRSRQALYHCAPTKGSGKSAQMQRLSRALAAHMMMHILNCTKTQKKLEDLKAIVPLDGCIYTNVHV